MFILILSCDNSTSNSDETDDNSTSPENGTINLQINNNTGKDITLCFGSNRVEEFHIEMSSTEDIDRKIVLDSRYNIWFTYMDGEIFNTTDLTSYSYTRTFVFEGGYDYVLDIAESSHEFTGRRKQTIFYSYEGYIGSDVKSPGKLREPEDLVIVNDSIFVVDTDNHRINKYNLNGDFIMSIGNDLGPYMGSDDGEFIFPRAIATDSEGLLYVLDTQNERVQVIDQNGVAQRMFGTKGTGDGEFEFPYDISIDENDNIYIADTYNNRIQKLSKTGEFITSWLITDSNDTEYKPRIIQIFNNKIYVKCVSNSIPYSYDLDGSNKQTETKDYWDIYVAGFKSTGEVIYLYNADGSTETTVTGLAVDDYPSIYINGEYFYILEAESYTVKKMDKSGNLIFTLGDDVTLDEHLNTPVFMDLDEESNLYIADSYNHTVKVFDKDGLFKNKISSYGDYSTYVRSVSYSPLTGNIINYGMHGIAEFTKEGTFVKEISNNRTNRGDIEIDNEGYIYFSDTTDMTVTKLDPSGTEIITWGSDGREALNFYYPEGLNFDFDNNLIIADRFNSQIKKYSKNGEYISLYDHLDVGFVVDTDVDADGNIYIVTNDPTNSLPAVIVVNKDYEYIGEFGYRSPEISGFYSPQSIRIDSEGTIYVSDDDECNVKIFKQSTGDTRYLGRPKYYEKSITIERVEEVPSPRE